MAGFSNLVTEMFSSFKTVITELSGGLKDAFVNLVYVDPAVENPEFSPVILFVFTMAGIGIATGILYKIFGMVRSRNG